MTETHGDRMSENLNSDRDWHRITRINIKKNYFNSIKKIQINRKACFDIADSNQSQVLRRRRCITRTGNCFKKSIIYNLHAIKTFASNFGFDKLVKLFYDVANCSLSMLLSSRSSSKMS